MTTITFDTLKFVRILRDGGFDERQAEAVADAFRDAQTDSDFPNRYDLAELELRLKHELELTRLELRDTERRLTIKLGTFIALATGLLLAAIKL